MTTRHIRFADKTLQAALFETMILAAGADGSVTRVEVEEIYRRVFERPEFHGIQAKDLKAAISHAAAEIDKRHDLEHILPSIAERLPDASSRELAFGLAVAVAVADHHMPRSELAFLKALQQAFSLPDEAVARLFEAAQEKGPLPLPAT